MRLLDVNVLVYALREAAPDHENYRRWLEAALDADEPVGLSDFVLAGVIRVATHPRIFEPPTDLGDTLGFVAAVRSATNVVAIAPGPRHWEIFSRLCTVGSARGNLVMDAYLAALAVESGSELITTDRDFARFPGLRWRHPLG